MTEDIGSANPGTKKTPKEALAESEALFKAALARKASNLEFMKGVAAKEKARKEEKAESAPEPVPTTKAVQVSLDQVIALVKNGRDENEEIPYEIKGTGGAGAQIWLRDLAVGSVKGAVGTRRVPGDQQAKVGEVDEINVTAGYQGRGLGYVLAIAFLVGSEAEEATYIQLGTEDTSEGFWTSLNVGQNRLITIEEVKSKVRNFNIRW
jgi:hypothetical protein